MPIHTYKCSKCEFSDDFIIGATTGAEPPTDCPECGEVDCMEKQFNMSRISGEVVGGYDYEYGKKSWKRTGSMADKAAILNGTKDPY